MSTTPRVRAAIGALVVGIGLLVACQPAGAVLHGRLTAAGTGAPAAGAAVRVYSAATETLVAETVANGDGSYQFPTSALPNGTYRVRFSAADWWNGAADWSTATDVLVNASTPVRIDATVTPVVGALEGKVTYDDGTVLDGATVQAVSSRTGEVIATAIQPPTGRYRFEQIAVGSYRLRGYAPGFAASYADYRVTPAGSPVVSVTADATTIGPSIWLEHEGLLAGTLTAAGQPLAGMLVTARITGSTEVAAIATTAANGTFTLERMNPVGHTLTITDPTGVRPAVVVNDGTRNLDLTPGARTTLQVGRVDMATGRLTIPTPAVPVPAAGAGASCALGSNGRIGCWGDGLSTKTVPPPGSGFIAVESSFTQTCGLTIEARVWCNGDVQARPGTFVTMDAGPAYMGCGVTTRATLACWGSGALATPPMGTFKAVSMGSTHGCAIARDDTIRCWGSNGSGESTPPMGTFTSVSAGASSNCATATDGTLRCWGLNNKGQTSPPAGRFTAVTMGGSHGCGLAADATLQCWGDNSKGQATAPAGTFAAVSAGGGHTCATSTAGRLSCWGENTSGEATVPAPVQDIAVGGLHACRIQADATLACWGYNDQGQLSAPSGQFTSVAAGLGHSCAIAVDETLRCWGRNAAGESTPPAGTFSSVDVGTSFGCAVATAGALQCWGTNAYGEATPPVGSYTAVSAGTAFACAVASDGTLRCWGDNSKGQSTPPSGTYTAVAAGSGYACAIATGGTLHCWGDSSSGLTSPPAGTYSDLSADNGTCALATDGTVRCWGGSNTFGQNVVPPGTYASIAVGSTTRCATRPDGYPVCWGMTVSKPDHVG